MDTDGCDLELAFQGPIVKGLDVLEDVFKFEWTARYRSGGQTEKHKGIIRVRRMG